MLYSASFKQLLSLERSMSLALEHILIELHLIFRSAMWQYLRRVNPTAGMHILLIALAVDIYAIKLVFGHVVDLQNSR